MNISDSSNQCYTKRLFLLEVLEEIHITTTDEYGTKASGLLHLLEKFNTLFGLKLSYRLFSAVEQLSLSLQKKNITIQDALSAVETAKEHFKHLRSDEEFNGFYEKALRFVEEKGIEQPLLPRNEDNLSNMTLEVNLTIFLQ